MTDTGNSITKKLLFWGALLFLFGILQGGIVQQFLNPRMGLSAHLAAIQSGLTLMVFGLIWNHLKLNAALLKTTYFTSLYSMYLIWIGLTVSAIFGASKATPIAGSGFSADPNIELITQALIFVGAVAGIVSAVLVCLGLYKNLKST